MAQQVNIHTGKEATRPPLPKKRRKWPFIGLAILLVLVLASFLVGYFSLDFAVGEDVIAKNIHVEAGLLENGDLRIVDTTTFRLKDRGRPYWNFYRVLSQYDVAEVYDVALYDHDLNEWYTFDSAHINNSTRGQSPSYTCYLDDIGGYRWEIGYNFPDFDKGTRTFSLYYTLAGVEGVAAYTDTDTLYYQFHQDDAYPVDTFSLTLNFPNAGGREDMLAWLHCTAKSTLVIESENQITVTADKVPLGTFIEVRLALPPGSVHTENVKSWDGLAHIKEEELTFAKEWAGGTRYRWLFAALGLVAAVGAIVLAGFMARLQKRRDQKSIPDAKKAEYRREVPYPGVSPAVAGRLMGYVDKKSDSPDDRLSASVLSLAHKGWLVLQQNEAGQLWITPTQGGTMPPGDEENHLLQLFLQVAAKNAGRFSMAQYKIYVKSSYQTANGYLSRYQSSVQKQLRGLGWLRGQGLFTSVCGWAMAVFIAAAAVLFFTAPFFGYGVLVAGLVVAAVVCFAGAAGRIVLSAAGAEAYLAWCGFARYLREFSLMDEREAQEVTLWGDWLVYGTALGVGTRVSNQLQALYRRANGEEGQAAARPMGYDPMGGYFGHSTVFHYPDVHTSSGGGSSPGGGFNPIGSMLRDIRETGRAVAAEGARIAAQSSGSGGSGGGGGGSGGGGGGSGGGSSGFR